MFIGRTVHGATPPSAVYTYAGDSVTPISLANVSGLTVYKTLFATNVNIPPAAFVATNSPANGYALRYTNGTFYWAP